VLVALSGGSDSVALATLLLALGEYGDFQVAGVAHFNHQLRDTAARDEAFCRSLAERLRLPIVVDTADVRAHARQHGLSTEDAARRVRYEFLERTADALKATRIATGHTQDDQAETLLLKLMRGAGLTGLGGVYPRRGRIIRPLLDVSRADLRRYLESAGAAWVEDETNDDLDNPRNRIRHRVLPELDRAAGGATRPAIARAAALIREDGQWLDDRADECWGTAAVRRPDGIEFELHILAGIPPPILRRLLLRGMRVAAGDREVGLEHVEAVMAVLASGAGSGSGGIDIPGARMELRAGKLVLIQQKPVQR
jgi:tRNA(Ile)-lysidine synthase